jgi:hypothetical protein
VGEKDRRKKGETRAGGRKKEVKERWRIVGEKDRRKKGETRAGGRKK